MARSTSSASTACSTQIELISISPDGNNVGFGASSDPHLDSTGRYVFFTSDAANLVASDGNSTTDLFRRDAGITVADGDGDGVADDADNCPSTSNANQNNNDSDTEGDACDTDDDGDNVPDVSDNCQFTANANQDNADSDAEGDACDSDDDNDGESDRLGQLPDHCERGSERQRRRHPGRRL